MAISQGKGLGAMTQAMVTELLALTMLTMAFVGLAYSAVVLTLLTFWEIRQKVRCWRVRREFIKH